MSLPVIISETGLRSYEAICTQISERLGNKALKDFKINTIKTLELIGSSPLIFRQTEFDANIRIGLINKLSSVFYQVKPDKIEVLFFGIIGRNHFRTKKDKLNQPKYRPSAASCASLTSSTKDCGSITFNASP